MLELELSKSSGSLTDHKSKKKSSAVGSVAGKSVLQIPTHNVKEIAD